MGVGRRSHIVALGALGCCLALASGAQAEPDRQTASLRYSTTEPGSPTGSALHVDFRDPSDPAGKPRAIQTITIDFHPGTTFDTSAVEQCKASDAQLMAQGAAACPAASRLQTGLLITDSGSPGVIPRFSDNHLTNFNNQDELVGLAETTSPPTRMVSRSPVGRSTVTIGFPAIPGGPPDFLLGYKSLTTTGPPAESAGRTYARTPPACPASGHWTNSFTFVYRDGVSQRQDTQTPCRAAGTTPGGARCLAPRAPIGRRRIGRVALGATRARLLGIPASATTPRPSVIGFCVKHSKRRVVAVLGGRGRTRLVASTAGGHGNRGVRPGRSARAARRAYPRSRRLLADVLRAGPRSAKLIGVRPGRVSFVAVADRTLLKSPRSLRRALRRAGL